MCLSMCTCNVLPEVKVLVIDWQQPQREGMNVIVTLPLASQRD
jgi:hypothetical protein